jgi:hypothetical protein
MAFSAFDFTDFDKRFSLFLRCRSPASKHPLCDCRASRPLTSKLSPRFVFASPAVSAKKQTNKTSYLHPLVIPA